MVHTAVDIHMQDLKPKKGTDEVEYLPKILPDEVTQEENADIGEVLGEERQTAGLPILEAEIEFELFQGRDIRHVGVNDSLDYRKDLVFGHCNDREILKTHRYSRVL